MPKKIDDNNAGIVLKGRNEVKPSEVDLSYLINDLKTVKNTQKHDYDIHINSIDLSSLNFIEEKAKNNLEVLFKKSEILSIDKVGDLRLLDLSMVGLGIVPDSKADEHNNDKTFKYSYLNRFIDCVNKTIDYEVQQELSFSERWQNQYTINIDKFKKTQCKNKVGFFKLYLLKVNINQFIKKIIKINKKPDVAGLKSTILNIHSFLSKNLILGRRLDAGKSLFMKLGMLYSEKIEVNNKYSKDYLIELLHEYYYFLKYYNFFLSNTLHQLKKKKIKKIAQTFTVDSYELKKESLNMIQNLDYTEYNMYNINLLYDYFRESLILNINSIIDKDIKKRKIIDGIFQYVPSAIGVAAFFVTMFMLFYYNYTLLKEMDSRYKLLIIFSAITVCAIIAGINLYRNSKQFKRPKRKKFSISSLISYAVITVVFFGLYFYFINRYDGYDNTYYYVNADDGNIIIDGLVDDDNSKYTIPETIDELNVVLVSKKVFKKNKEVQIIDFTKSNTNLAEAAFKDCTNLKQVIISDSIKSIPDNSFENCKNLTTIDLKDIQSIGKAAFSGCVNLKNVDISKIINLNNFAFQNCYNLGTINFNEHLSVIPNGAFKNCYILEFTGLPDNLNAIKEEAFSNCRAISSLVLSSNIQTIEKNAFQGCNNIKTCTIENFSVIKNFDLNYVFGKDGLKKANTISINNCTEIPDNVFADYINLANLTIGGDITKIGKNAFKNCSRLAAVSFEGNCSYIGEGAFSDCRALNSIDFENLSIEIIQNNTFNNCSSLTSFIIPDTVTEIKDKAFYGCNKYNSIVIPNSVKNIGKQAFGACEEIENLSLPYINEYLKLIDFLDIKTINSLKTIEYKDAVQISDYFFDGCNNLSNLITTVNPVSIGNYAFKDCTKLSDFSFTGSATKIGIGSFYNCKLLTDIVLDDKINEIPDYAFYRCNLLTELKLPANTKRIGKSAYYGCSGISKIDINANITSIDDNAFDNCYNVQYVKIPLITKPVKDFLGNNIAAGLTSVDIFVASNTSMADYFLSDCSKLATISLSGNLTSIGKYAFSGCSSLESFDIPSSVKTIDDFAFNNCTAFKAVNIPENVNDIGIGIYTGCKNVIDASIYVSSTKSFNNYFNNSDILYLNSLVIKGTNNIPNNYFKDFTNLKKFNFSGYEQIGSNAFNNTGLTDIDITDIKAVKSAAFANCKELQSATLGVGVTEIPDSLFVNCNSLLIVSGSTNISQINKSAFENCNKLKEFDFKNITYIGKNAFKNCNLITEIIFTKNNVKIEKEAFNGCYSLNQLAMPQLSDWRGLIKLNYYFDSTILNQIKTLSLYNVKNINSKVLKNCNNIKTISLFGEIEKIDAYTFDGMDKLETVVLPDSVKVMGKYAFRNCKKLKDINIPINLEKIEKRAFSNCESITSMTLPSNMSYIGKEAFGGTTIVVRNTGDVNQANINKWHKEWNNREMHDDLLSILEDLSIWVYIVTGVIFVGIVGLIIAIVIVKKRRKIKQKPENDCVADEQENAETD